MSSTPTRVASRVYHTCVCLLAVVALLLWLPQLTYPAWPALVLVSMGAILLWLRPAAWLILLPALWPVIDLVPSTGRMYFTESDALAALCVFVLGLHRARQPAATPANLRRSGPGLTFLVLLAGIALSYLISSVYALTPLPPFDDNMFVGYASPFNALRLSKGLLWALLLLPHWIALYRQDGDDAHMLLRIGMTAGLATASIAALWERAAFTTLFDFAADYRTTAMFWEMHVGGAALDGWLMLTLPFALAGALGARRPLAIAAHLAVLALGAYAILTTFSRGVYLGCALMLLAAAPAWWRQRRDHRPAAVDAAVEPNPWLAALLFVLLTGAAIGVFHGGGYRGLAAMFASGGVVFMAGGLLRPMRPRAWLRVAAVAGPLAAVSYLLHAGLPKAAYWLFGIAFAASLASAYVEWKKPSARTRILLAISTAWCATGAGWVCWHWGGDRALPAGLVASGLLSCVLIAQTVLPRPIWLLDRRESTAALASSLMALSIAVGAGSYFIGERFSTVGGDFGVRLEHWRESVALIENPREWALGIGVGRYAERYSAHSPASELPGTWRIARGETADGNENDKPYLHLVAPQYPLGFFQILRVSQRIGVDLTGPFSLKVRARAPTPIRLNVEVCQKHLLYPAQCARGGPLVVPGGNKWTELSHVLSHKPFDQRGPWAPSRILNFSVGIATEGKSADIDNIELFDARGNSLLANQDFAQGADHWFFSSDRVHLPYHAKNMLLHLLVEQGVFGMWAVALACLAAIWRLGLGRASLEKPSPVLLAALSGFLTVGLFDSLLDVPRDATFFFLLLGVALAMRPERRVATPHFAEIQASPKVGAGNAAVAGRASTGWRLGRSLSVICGFLALPGAALWMGYQQIGRTPGEILDHFEKQLHASPRANAIALPTISRLRKWLDAPSLEERRRRGFFVPPPPPLVLTPMAGRPASTLATAQILRVGPTAPIRTIAEAARLAHDDDIIEILAGEYHGDVATWTQKKLTIRGVGGHARLYADGQSAEGKAIWVIRNGDFDIANIDFIGARAADKNGAGIRLEAGALRIAHCLFFGNQNGILTASANARLEIHASEFAYSGAGDGLSHNLYVGAIDSLTVEGSYFHHANVGHLIKSRAAENHILYNRLTDEDGGRASYELEFPNGGIAYVIGNIIEQRATTEDSTIISFGAEGYKWPKNELYLINNTIDNEQPWGGTYLAIKPGAGMVRVFNNFLIGKGILDTGSRGTFANNPRVGWEDLVLAARQDYRVKAGRSAWRKFVAPGTANGINLTPTQEYVHPTSTRALTVAPTLPGAQQTLQSDTPEPGRQSADKPAS